MPEILNLNNKDEIHYISEKCLVLSNGKKLNNNIWKRIQKYTKKKFKKREKNLKIPKKNIY